MGRHAPDCRQFSRQLVGACHERLVIGGIARLLVARRRECGMFLARPLHPGGQPLGVTPGPTRDAREQLQARLDGVEAPRFDIEAVEVATQLCRGLADERQCLTEQLPAWRQERVNRDDIGQGALGLPQQFARTDVLVDRRDRLGGGSRRAHQAVGVTNPITLGDQLRVLVGSG